MSTKEKTDTGKIDVPQKAKKTHPPKNIASRGGRHAAYGANNYKNNDNPPKRR